MISKIYNELNNIGEPVSFIEKILLLFKKEYLEVDIKRNIVIKYKKLFNKLYINQIIIGGEDNE